MNDKEAARIASNIVTGLCVKRRQYIGFKENEWLEEQIARALLATTQEGGGELEVPPLRSGADPGARKMEEPKPCPFCGSDEISHGYQSPPERGIVQCHSCDAFVVVDAMHAANAEEAAIDAWNRRAHAGDGEVGEKLWLWRDGEDRFLAFRSLFPTMPGCGDPATLGQPSGYAFYHRMTLAEAQAVSRDPALAQSRTPASQGEVRTEGGPGGPLQAHKGEAT